MTRDETKNFEPSPEMIRAAENCFAAMAYTKTIRPIVDAYQRRILAEMQAPLAEKWKERGRHTDEIILNPDHTYLMEDADFQTYLARCREEQARAGLHTESPDHCPLLVAQHLQVKAEWVLIEAMEPITHIAEVSGDHRKRLLDLTLRFLAPFCDTAGTLKRLKAA